MSHLGFHFILDCFDCDSKILDSMDEVEAKLNDVARSVGATVLESRFRSFGPGQGFSGALLLSESHVTIHTWPDERFAAVDFYTCGEIIDPSRSRAPIEALLGSQKSESFVIRRGDPATGIEETPRAHSGTWASEGDGTLALSLRHRGKIFHGESQDRLSLEVIENHYFGKVILHGGQILVTEKDYRNFSEAQVHPLFFLGRKIRRVLILGGGDGALLSEILRHPVTEVIVVDRDPRISEICRREFPAFRKAFADKRVRHVTEDGAEFLKSLEDHSMDWVIVDFTPVFDNSGTFFQSPTLKKLRKLIHPQGFLLMQGGTLKEIESLGAPLKKLLAKNYLGKSGKLQGYWHLMQQSAPSVATGTWVSILLAQKSLDPRKKFDRRGARTWLKKNPCKTLDEENFMSVFSVSKNVRDCF